MRNVGRHAVGPERPLLSLIATGLSVLAIILVASGCSVSKRGNMEPAAQRPVEIAVFVGTYTSWGQTRSEGVYVYNMDPATGALKPAGVGKGVVNPSFVTVDPQARYLFSANEAGKVEGKPAGGVAAFAIDPKTKALTLLNQQYYPDGGPCYVCVEQTGKYALTANYGKGDVVMVPIAADGKAGPPTDTVQHQGSSVNPDRQKGPHAHSISTDPGNRYAYAADLGLDKILIYEMDLKRGKLVPHGDGKVKPGSGPRHLAFHPSGRYAYVINELNSTMTAFACDPEKGTLEEMQTLSTLPDDFKRQSFCADVHVSPSGEFVYGSNRGHDSIAIFAIDEKTGKLAPVGWQPTGGKTPRGFAIDPTGNFLLAANQDTNTIVVFRIDSQTGKLTQAGPATDVPVPVCVKVVSYGEGGKVLAVSK